ncbi:hypothetical protein JXR93_06700 [bacterium]|nr:hypothetical protein [bacterium]
MRKKIVLFIFLLITNLLFGQTKFEIKNASKNYLIIINIEKCKNDDCEGKGTVELIDKKTDKTFQILNSNYLYFSLDSLENPATNIIKAYDKQNSVLFDDFNFDGIDDIAIRNGNGISYGSPSYDVYLYDINKKQFILNQELTNLASKNLGIFKIDKNKKRLVTYEKSGCCWHIKKEYELIPKKGLLKVYELEEDSRNGKIVLVTTRYFVNNKWIIKSIKYKISDYYKK